MVAFSDADRAAQSQINPRLLFQVCGWALDLALEAAEHCCSELKGSRVYSSGILREGDPLAQEIQGSLEVSGTK